MSKPCRDQDQQINYNNYSTTFGAGALPNSHNSQNHGYGSTNSFNESQNS